MVVYYVGQWVDRLVSGLVATHCFYPFNQQRVPDLHVSVERQPDVHHQWGQFPER
jgi:hypothetical protein